MAGLPAVFLAGLPAVFLAGLPARAAQDDAQQVLENVRQKYESVNDAELHFSQKVKFPLSKLEQSVSGTLYLKKDKKYRVETPSQTIVTDGATVWSYSPASQQVLIDHYKETEGSLTPERLLTGAAGGFQPALVGRTRLGKTDVVEVKLIPLGDQGLVSTVRLWVDEHDWMVRQVEIVDANGKQTTYTVQQSRVNIGLPDSRFSFQPPEGTDVVDLR
ncbi:MAG TPA: outer membrane lipoprotein carrier protein LolA [Bacteroidota bacterium]